MSSLQILDLARSEALDRRAMLCVIGAGAPWVFGAFRPFLPAAPAAASPVVNFFQVTNNYLIVDKMINQFTNVEIANTGDNANLTTVLFNSLGA
jgi:hypothetical protein